MGLITGLIVGTQRPLDEVRQVKNVASISSLGTDNYLAYLYYMNLVVHCLEEDKYYQWRVPKVVDEVGLLPSNFTYPGSIIEYGIDYSALEFNFFLVLNAEGIELNNLGTGAFIYKDITFPSVGVKRFNLRSLKVQDAAVGTSLIESFTVNSDDITLAMKVLESDDIILDTSVAGKLKLKIPSSSALSDFYLRKDAEVTYFDWLKANTLANGGVPVIGYQYKGYGTLSKPFVDTVVYTLGSPLVPPTITANSAVLNAKIAYIGTGTFDSPQFGGRRLRVQPTTTQHVFVESLNVNTLILRLETGANMYSIPVATTGEDSWMINLDHSSIGTDDSFAVVIEKELGSTLTVARNGIKNRGTSVGTFLYQISKQVVIRSEGTLFQNRTIEDGDTAGDYTLIDCNSTAVAGRTNDGNALISVTGGRIFSVINPIFKGGIHVCDFTNVEFSYGTIGRDIDPNIVPFIESNTNLYTRLEKCSFYVYGNQVPKTLFKITGINSQILLIEPLVNGIAESLVSITPHVTTPALDGSFTMYNGTNKDGFTATVTLFNKEGARAGRWHKIYFNNNYITKGVIDETKVDLTNDNYQGVVNFIGRPADSNKQISYFLPRFGSRLAASALLPSGSAFINTNGLPIGTPDPSWKMDIVI